MMIFDAVDEKRNQRACPRFYSPFTVHIISNIIDPESTTY